MKTQLNLLPKQIQDKHKKRDDILLVIPASIVLVIFFIFNIFISADINNSKQQIAVYNQEIIQINQQYVKFKEQLRDIEEIKDKIVSKKEQHELINKLFSIRQIVSGLFKEISLIIPENVWLKRIVFSNMDESLLIEGQSFRHDSVQKFLFELKNSSELSNVELKSTELINQENPIVNFIINSKIVRRR